MNSGDDAPLLNMNSSDDAPLLNMNSGDDALLQNMNSDDDALILHMNSALRKKRGTYWLSRLSPASTESTCLWNFPFSMFWINRV